MNRNIEQQGQRVNSDGVIFRINSSLSYDQVQQIEEIVNEFINKNLDVHLMHVDLDEIKQFDGIRRLNVVYPKISNVIAIGTRELSKCREYPIELCCGT